MHPVKTGLAALCLAAGASSAWAQVPPAAAQPPPQQRPAPRPGDPKEVEGVTVTAERPDIQTAIDRRSYTLGKDLQATTGSIADALRNVPSLDVDLNGNLSLRGEANVTILVDGKPAPQFQGAGRADALQQLPADQIDRVEVITNPSAALTPEGSGGVINLITKRSRGAGTSSSVYVTAGSQGLKRAGLNFGYNSKALNITGSLSGNYQRNKGETFDTRTSIDPITGAERPSTFRIVGSNLNRTPSGRLNLTYTLGPKTQLTASASANSMLLYGHPYNGFEDFDTSLRSVSLLNRQGYRRLLIEDSSLTGGWKHSFGDKHDLSLDVIRNETQFRDHVNWLTYQQRPLANLPLEQTLDEFDLVHSELKLAYARPMPDSASLKAGYELKTDDQDFLYRAFRGTSLQSLRPEALRSNRFDFEQTIHTGYATYERPIGDFNVQLGLRLEDVEWDIDQLTSGQQVGQHYFRAYPSLHLGYKLDDERKLTASYSHRIQRPPPVLLNPRRYEIDPRNFQQGNPDLKPQDTESFELGFEQRHKGNYYLATLYYRENSGEFSPVLRSLGAGTFVATFENLGSSNQAGVELVANGKLTTKLSYNASANLYRNHIDAGNIADGRAITALGVGGRANLNWQVRPDDLIQVNAFMQGKRLGAQGYVAPVYTLNLGWRHKFNDKVTATITAQDVLATNRFKRNLDSPLIRERLVNDPVSRAVVIRLDYRFGMPSGRPAREPGFEYEGGGGGGGGPTGPG